MTEYSEERRAAALAELAHLRDARAHKALADAHTVTRVRYQHVAQEDGLGTIRWDIDPDGGPLFEITEMAGLWQMTPKDPRMRRIPGMVSYRPITYGAHHDDVIALLAGRWPNAELVQALESSPALCRY